MTSQYIYIYTGIHVHGAIYTVKTVHVGMNRNDSDFHMLYSLYYIM